MFIPAAVAGMNWAMPSAPAELTAVGSNPLSWESNAANNAAGMPLLVAACSMVDAYSAGTVTFPITVLADGDSVGTTRRIPTTGPALETDCT